MSRHPSADMFGGLAASAVLLPQAMAFGTAMAVATGATTASGAAAGLVCAIVLSLVSGVFGGTDGLVSAPNGPTYALLSGVALTLAATHGVGSHLVISITAVLVVAGLAQVALGLARGGELMKYIPYPVVAGFMTGSALLMIKSQLGPALGRGAEGDWSSWRFIPILVVIVTFAAICLAPRWQRVLPGPLVGLATGTVAYHVLVLLGPGSPPQGWSVGALPAAAFRPVSFEVGSLGDLPWGIIVPSGLALAIVASLNALLASVVVDSLTGSRHEARRQLIGQGLGLAATGMLGGIAGSGTTGASVVAVRAGGRRWAGAACGAALLVILLVAGRATAWLPLSALAGIVLHVAIVGTVERDIAAWALQPRRRLDALTALLVVAVTVLIDLVTAVEVGVSLAILQFIRQQVRAPVVHRRSTAAQRPSLRRRSPAARELIAKHGDRIVLYELEGNLFFGTADRLWREMQPDIERPAWILLEMGRVTQVDLSAVHVLSQMQARLAAQGGRLSFANVHSQLGMGVDVGRTLAQASLRVTQLPVRTFVDADEALEAAEDELLTSLGHVHGSVNVAVGLAEMPLLSGLSSDDIAAISRVLVERTARAGEILFRIGDASTDLWLVRRGDVEARLPTTEHHYKRLAKFGPGTVFGEVTFVEGGVRTADAVVSHDAELLMLDRNGFAQLERLRPAAALRLVEALASELGKHLRAADGELRRLMGS